MSFNCKLNKKYKLALKYKSQDEKISLATICHYYYGNDNVKLMLTRLSEKEWRKRYEEDIEMEIGEEMEDNYDSILCCGISELCTGCAISADNPYNRHMLAKRISQLSGNSDKRIFFTGLPMRKVGEGSSVYNFKNYKVIRKILLDFGMKQVTPKFYKNINSNNMLSVLVGQCP